MFSIRVWHIYLVNENSVYRHRKIQPSMVPTVKIPFRNFALLGFPAGSNPSLVGTMAGFFKLRLLKYTPLV